MHNFDFIEINQIIKGMPAPWIQIKLCQIIGLLSANDQKASEHAYEILAMALQRSDDTGINIGYSIVFQCVKAIAQIYPNKKLLDQAAISVSKFFHSGNNNLKYLGINSLKMLMNIDQKYASNHQITVVECLESSDETLRRETLELLFKMTNQDNIEVIMERLMNHLKISTDSFFKKEMVYKIIQLIERYAPSQEWFFINTNYLFEYASEHINDNILNEMIKIIYEISVEDDEFNQLMFNTYQITLQNENLSDPFVKLISWIFGQIGSEYYKNDQDQLGILVNQLIKLMNYDYQDDSTQSWIINSLAKLNIVYQNKQIIKDEFKKFKFSKRSDISQRCLEYELYPQFLPNLLKSLKIDKIDQKLEFLNNFIQQARNQGAKEYKESLFEKCFLNSQNISQSQKLVFQPYSVLNNKSVVVNESNEIQLNFQGQQKWGKQGYIKEDKETTLNVPKVTNQSIQSISSNQYQTNSSISSSSNNLTGSSKETSIPVISAGGVTQSNYQKATFNQDIQPAPKIVYDPKEKQKQQLANQLFGGKPTTSLSSNKQTFKANKNKEQDLFDLNDEQVIKQPVIQQQKYTPLNINLSQYEQYWEKMPDEMTLNLEKSKISSQDQFQKLIQQINFNIIEVIDNEFICAGIQGQNIILLYAEINQSTHFSVKIKAEQQNEKQNISDQIKKLIQ